MDEHIQGKGAILLRGLSVSGSRIQVIRRKQDWFSRNTQSSWRDEINHQGTAMNNVRHVVITKGVQASETREDMQAEIARESCQ